MGCASCGKNSRKGNGYIEPKARENPPFSAGDMQLYNAETGETRKFEPKDWNTDRHKLLLFFPETFTPVCTSEMGALDKWVGEFDKLGVDVFAVTADPIHAVKDWYENDETLKGSTHKVISSYILPSRLGIMNGGRVKRASVFMMTNGDVVVSETFMKVGRSIEELHRMAYAYTQDTYCGEGWKSPADGFLNDGNSGNSKS